MKHITILIVALGCILLTACSNDWLDKAQPSTAGNADTAIKSSREAQYVLNGIYSLMRVYEYYGARMTYYGDVTGEDMQSNGDTKRSAKYYLFDLNKETTPSSLWYQPYRVIRNANTLVDYTNNVNIESLTNKEKSEINDIRGQALTIRAMAHFDLVKVFGVPYTKDNGASLGVPIETAKHDATSRPTRNTVAQVYKQIIDDLNEAKTLIGTSLNNGQLNWYGSQLLLARAYLYTDENEKAFKVASELIKNAEKVYKLWSTEEYASVWEKDFTSEIIFELSVLATEGEDSEEGENKKEGIGYLLWQKGYDDIILTSDYIDLLNEDPNDVRNKIISSYTDSKKITRYYLNKYPGNKSTGENPENADIPVLRLTEAYLIAAEAAVKESDNTNAVKYLNAIVKRANPEKEVIGTVTLEQVLKERRREFVGEGHRLFDAMRNNQTIERKGTSHTSPLLTPQTRSFDRTFYKTVMAIPKQEMDANKNMVQNPQY